MSRKLFDATSSNVYYKTFGNFLTSNSFCITAKKVKFSIKGFFSTCDQIHILLRFWSHLLKKFLYRVCSDWSCLLLKLRFLEDFHTYFTELLFHSMEKIYFFRNSENNKFFRSKKTNM